MAQLPHISTFFLAFPSIICYNIHITAVKEMNTAHASSLGTNPGAQEAGQGGLGCVWVYTQDTPERGKRGGGADGDVEKKGEG